MKRILSIDYETFCEADIRETGSYRYILDDTFEVLMCAFAFDNEPVRVLDFFKTEDRRYFDTVLRAYLLDDPNVEIHAHNAAFELMVTAKYFGVPVTYDFVDRFRCTMVHALYCGFPGSLANVGAAMGLPQDKRKMAVGTQLIGYFSKPRKPTKTMPDRVRTYPKDEPEKWELFKQYCGQDVETEREIGRRLSAFPVPDREQRLWVLDILANYGGVGVDMELVRGAIALNDANTQALMAEAKRITKLENPNSVQQLLAWMDRRGVATQTIRKADVSEMLEDDEIPDDVRRVLEIRRQLCKTSCKKYDAITEAVWKDGRIRGIMQFYGASRTGRWAGRLIQLQNLPQNHLEDLPLARSLVKARDAEMLKMVYGDSVPDTLSQLIRTAFVPEKGKAYVIADYASIEAVVIAWLAGEQWILDTFTNGGDIYCRTASQMFGVPVEKHGVNAHLRKKGKICQLACGYSGGKGAMVNMGALKMGLEEDELPELVMMWRKANPKIVGLWKQFDDALMTVLKDGVAVLPKGIVLRRESANGMRFMTMSLPSGRKTFYNDPHIAPARNFPDRMTFHYYGQNQVTRKWEATDTFGGKLVENAVQAIARDILCETILKLNARGFNPVFSVHDEVIVEVPEERKEDGLKMVLGIMRETPRWVDGYLPLKGAGFTAGFYQKD